MLEDLLHPLTQTYSSDQEELTFGGHTTFYMETIPDWESADIAIVGVLDGRHKQKNKETALAPDAVRKAFYKLAFQNPNIKLVDLGNIKPGELVTDSEVAVQNVVEILLGAGTVPIILGGDIAFGMPIFKGFAQKRDNIDCSLISPYLKLKTGSLLSNLCLHQPNRLFNINVLGYQSHYTDPGENHTFEKMYFEAHRLGIIKSKLNEAEPILRNTDLVLVDIGAVKQADAPGNYYNNPSGFTAEEICQLAWFSGIAEKAHAFGLFEINPEYDYRDTTSKLGAQILWYFIDGFYSRSGDHPSLHKEFTRYRCALNDRQPDILFYKSRRTDRWWMEIPNLHNTASRNKITIPCTYNDYNLATKGEMPDRFFKALQRMPK